MGFFLHTWGRDFTVYNPHMHFVVPGAGVSADGSKWLISPENFLLVEKTASLVFAGKFRSAMEEAGRVGRRVQVGRLPREPHLCSNE